MKSFFKRETSIILFFIVIAIIAFWQVALLHNCLINDMLDCYLPWRLFVTDCIADKTFPFWCPYQMFGYPIHADMRSILSPELWVSGLFLGKYTIYTLHFFFILYASVCGYSMYKLSSYIGADKIPAIAAGVAYMLSGYAVSQGQDLSSSAGTAWLPFVILYYIKLTKEFSLKTLLLSAVFQFLLITSAYPAITIVLQYLFLIIFIVFLSETLKQKDYSKVWLIIRSNLLLYGIILLLCAFYLTSLYYSINYVNRFKGIDVSKAMTLPFTPQSLLSLIFPFSSVKSLDFFATDFCMNNIYIGIILFIFFIYSFFRKKTFLEYIFILFGLFCLLASFGPYTPVRKLSCYLPLMSMFDNIGFFRIFIIVSLILVATVSLSNFLDDVEKVKKKLSVIVLILMLLIFCAVIFSIFHLKKNSIPFILSPISFLDTLANSDIYGHIFLQGIIQIGFLLSFLFITRFFERIKFGRISLLIIICLDMIVTVQLNSYYTVVNQYDTYTVKKHIDKQSRLFPIPEQVAIKENNDNSSGFIPLWQNTNTITKTISAGGFNSFGLKNYEYLIDSFPELYNELLKLPLIYLSNRIECIENYDLLKTKLPIGIVFLKKDDKSKIDVDTFPKEDKSKITVVDFSPNSVKAEIITNKKQLLCFNQSYYVGWECHIDGVQQNIVNSNVNFMSVLVPEGRHIVSFYYTNKLVFIGFLISYLTFIILVLLSIFLVLRERISVKFSIIAISAFIILCLFLLSAYLVTDSKSVEATNDYRILINKVKEYKNEFGNENIVVLLNCDRPDFADTLKETLNIRNVFAVRLQSFPRISQLNQIVDSVKAKRCIYFSNKVIDPYEVNFIISEKFPKLMSNFQLTSGRISIFSNEGGIVVKPKFSVFQDFNESKEFWKLLTTNKKDSTIIFNKHYPLYMDSINCYSGSFYCTGKQLPDVGKIRKVLLTVNFQTYDSLNSLHFVMKLNQPARTQREWYFPIYAYAHKNNVWHKATFSTDIKLFGFDHETLQIFIWNQGGKKALIGDATISFY